MGGLGLGDAQLALRRRARLEQHLRPPQTVGRKRLVGKRCKKLALRFHQVGRAQTRDRLTGLDRLVGGDEHRLDESVRRSCDHAQVLRRNDDRAGQRQLDFAPFLVDCRRRDAGGPDLALVHGDDDVAVRSIGGERAGGSRARDQRRDEDTTQRGAPANPNLLAPAVTPSWRNVTFRQAP